MEIALEAHEIQLEANKQLELVLEAVERRVPGMQAWMRNAVHVAQLANEKGDRGMASAQGRPEACGRKLTCEGCGLWLPVS